MISHEMRALCADLIVDFLEDMCISSMESMH